MQVMMTKCDYSKDERQIDSQKNLPVLQNKFRQLDYLQISTVIVDVASP